MISGKIRAAGIYRQPYMLWLNSKLIHLSNNGVNKIKCIKQQVNVHNTAYLPNFNPEMLKKWQLYLCDNDPFDFLL